MASVKCLVAYAVLHALRVVAQTGTASDAPVPSPLASPSALDVFPPSPTPSVISPTPPISGETPAAVVAPVPIAQPVMAPSVAAPVVLTSNPTVGPPTVCFLCNDGEIMETPDKEIPPYDRNYMCSNLEADIQNLTDKDCAATIDPTLSLIDLQAFCGCTGSLAPSICSSCEKGFYLPEENYDIKFEIPGAGNFTCEKADALTPYLTKVTNCTAWSQFVSKTCCEQSPPTTSPSPTPSAPSDSKQSSTDSLFRSSRTFVPIATGFVSVIFFSSLTA